MLTTASHFNSMTMEQIAKLFAVLPSHRGKQEAKPETKVPARPEPSPVSAAQFVAGEALEAIQALVLGNGAPAQTPVPAAARYAGWQRLTGGFESGDTQTAVIQGSAEGSSYAFSISANQQMDAAAGRPIRTSYSYNLEVDGRFVMSGWVNGGRDPSTDPVKITLDFSYAEAVSTGTGDGSGTLVQTGAFRAIAGHIAVDAGSLERPMPVLCGGGWQRQSTGLRISSDVTMASGCIQIASPCPSAPASACSTTVGRAESLETNLHIRWGA